MASLQTGPKGPRVSGQSTWKSPVIHVRDIAKLNEEKANAAKGGDPSTSTAKDPVKLGETVPDTIPEVEFAATTKSKDLTVQIATAEILNLATAEAINMFIAGDERSSVKSFAQAQIAKLTKES